MRINHFAFSKPLWAALAVAGAACHSGDLDTDPVDPVVTDPVVTDPSNPDIPENARLVAGPAIDLPGGVDPAELAFAATPGGLAAGYRTHKVELTDGIVYLTPRHWDDSTSSSVVGGSIGLETTSIAMGSQVLTSGVDSLYQPSVTEVSLVRGVVEEFITNREDGIEQSWHFADSPQGDADLVVEVAVTGQDFVAATDSGLHFRSDLGLGVRYSHAVWRDADGDAWELRAEFVDGRIRIAVPADIVAISTFPAVLDPTVSAEIFTDTPALGTSGADNGTADVASDGTDYFVVWQDRRNTRNDDIWGARVTAAGVITDSFGIEINTATTVQRNPTVAFAASGYVVAWENVVTAGNSDIVAAFVSTGGAVTQLGTVAGTGANETIPAVVGRGSDALLVWQSGSDVMAALYSGGSFGAPIAIAAGANVEKEPAVAADPAGSYLVTFTESVGTNNDDIRGQLVTSGGALSGTVFNVGSATGNQITSEATFDGTNFMVVYNNAGNIYGARVDTSGVLLDATGVAINSATDLQTVPDLACTASACMVVWQDRRNLATTSYDVYGALVTSAFAVTTNDIVVSNASRTQITPAIALAGGQYFSTWTDNRDGAFQRVTASRITLAGGVTDASGILLGTGFSRHQSASVARTGSGYGVFFDDARPADYDVVSVRFSSNGGQLDATPKVVTNAAAAQLSPTAVLAGSNFLVAWQDSRGADRDIYAARVNPSTGASFDPGGLAINTNAADQLGPKMAAATTTELVVWSDRRNGSFDIYGALLNQSGAVLANDIIICAGANDQNRPSVAYDSANGVYLVVWSDPQSGTADIRGARVSTAGAVLDASCGVVISGATGPQFQPAIAFGNGQFFVAWEDRRSDGFGDVYGARVTANGSIAVLDPSGIPISALAGSTQAAASVAAQGTSFVVAWEDTRNLMSTSYDIYGSRVTAVGAVEAAFAISTTSYEERAPNVGEGPPNNPHMVSYVKVRPDLDSVRIQVRRITFETATGQYCTQNSQCSTGFCVDNRCCNTACGGTTITDCQACSTARGAAVNGTCGIVPGPGFSICRNYAVIPGSCDLREYCDGVNPLCPPDIGINQGAVCTLPGGGGSGICPSNSPAGAPHICQ